jgi:hypothetical protein
LIVIAYHLVAYFRFLYGQVREFKDVQFAIDVFKFAHEMQITSLMHALSKFFETNGTGNALLFYEICTQLDYQQGSQMCKKVRKQIHFSSKVLYNRQKFQGVKVKKHTFRDSKLLRIIFRIFKCGIGVKLFHRVLKLI